MDEVMAFTATTDAVRARAFYEGVLGLRFVEDSPFALVFESGPTMLRIQKVKELVPHPFTQLGWKVADIHGKVRELVSRGVELLRPGFVALSEDGIWTTPDGTKVAWFKDPDGNTLSLTQFPG